MIYLQEKDITEFDGIEQFCHDAIYSSDTLNTKWLPIKLARILRAMRDKFDLYTVYSKLVAINNSMDKLEEDVHNEFTEQEKTLKESIKSSNDALLFSLQTELTQLAERVEQSERSESNPGNPVNNAI